MKRISAVLFALIISVAFALTLAACGEEALKTLQSAGFTAEGLFEDGITLAASKLDETGSDFASAVEKIANKYYDEEKLAVYDISLVKDNAKVQPDGSVKITMPAPFESETGYVTYHISGETVEELVTAFADGKISFETGSFSYFAVTAKVVTDITALELDAMNFGFAYNEDGTLADKTEYVIGCGINLDPQGVLVKGVTADSKDYLQKGVDYTIDLGGLNLEKAGLYTITYTLKADQTVKATLVVEVIDADKVIGLELDAMNFGFAYNEGGTLADKTEYVIGSGANLNPQNVLVKAVTWGETKNLSEEEYTIDLGGLNLEVEGTYTITYTLRADKSVKATLVVEVIDADKVIGLELDAMNFGFAYNEDGTLADKTEYVIGSGANLDPQGVLVKAVTWGETKNLSEEEYTIDLGGLNLEAEGTYTITYTLKADPTVKATLVVEVVA